MGNIKDSNKTTKNKNNKMNTQNNKNTGIFHDWNPREIAALERATSLLRLKQDNKKSKVVRPTLKGCYYHTGHHCYIVNFYDGVKRVYAGRLAEWNEAEALKIQEKAKIKYYNS